MINNKYSSGIDPIILKTAGFDLDSIKSTVKNMFSSEKGDEDKESFLNSIAPGLFFTLFKDRLGPLVSGLISLLMATFKVDVEGIIKSVWDSIKLSLNLKENISENEIDSIVDRVIKNNSKDPTKEDFSNFLKKESSISIRDAKIIKMAIQEQQQYGFSKTANFFEKFNVFKKIKNKSTGVFGGLLSTVLKTALASLGFMAAGKFLRETLDVGSDDSKSIQTSKSSQKHFPINPNYTEEQKNTKKTYWAFEISPSKSEIENLLIEFANDLYLGLENKNNLIKSTQTFQNLVNEIRSYNLNNVGGGITFIPKRFHSKRELVDIFIDEVVNLDLKGVMDPISTSDPSVTSAPSITMPTSTPTSIPVSLTQETETTSTSKQPATSAPPKPVKVTYPIVISKKWQDRMESPKQRELLSKLTPQEQKKVEEYLESLGPFDLLKINGMSEAEQIKMFKDMVRQHFGEEAYQRVNS